MTPAAMNIQLISVIERGRLFIRLFNAFANLPRELPIAPATLGPHPVLSLRQKLDLFRWNSNHLYLGCLGGRYPPDVVAHSLSRRVGKGYALVPVRKHLAPRLRQKSLAANVVVFTKRGTEPALICKLPPDQ